MSAESDALSRRDGGVDYARLAEVLVAFTRHLVSDYRPEDVLHELCVRTASLLDMTGAGVMLADDAGDLRFVAASDEGVREIERLQIELGEGPCLHAYLTQEQVVVADFTATDRFPRFTSEALIAGIRAVASFAMCVDDYAVGAINLYAAEPISLDDERRRIGQVLADVATGYVLNARAHERSSQLTEQLQTALDSRVVLEQAKGVLAEQLGVDVTAAFDRLRRHARSNGERLHAVAEDVVAGRLRLDVDADSDDAARRS